MERVRFNALCEFCADQYSAFDPQEWLDNGCIDLKARLLAAKYLSMTSWYGYEEDLEWILVKAGMNELSVATFHQQAAREGLDLATISAGVRQRIALRRRRPPALVAVPVHQSEPNNWRRRKTDLLLALPL